VAAEPGKKTARDSWLTLLAFLEDETLLSTQYQTYFPSARQWTLQRRIGETFPIAGKKSRWPVPSHVQSSIRLWEKATKYLGD
jgi:hypothetical protein